MNELTCTISDSLREIKVGALKQQNVLTVYEGWSIKKLSEFFIKHNISGAPVIAADDELIGVVTQSDVVQFEIKKPDEKEIAKIIESYIGPFGQLQQTDIERIKTRAIEYCTVNSIMTPSVHSMDESASLYDAYKLIKKHDIHRLFITRNSLLVGVITAMDILNYIVDSELS
ncbi:CBS domain-containing protein [Aliiglaciecola lipolytica]|uniref:Metal dependent phosphohydrolase n=1 Tax=Aliiglaciecola lipolytica E3 TaxID=1127673 RepID=K6Y872_9ALTE|nr:CBS domain-containing protein [Aliiglaciecola lipolytica]GAC12828.1 metal dependent phosphohydrolase [Aliiglaciecola lipolytica E3]